MPKVSQLPNKAQPALADILPLLDVAAGNTKSATLTEIANAIINSIVPSGSILQFAGATAPSGWILCQGQAVSRTTYSTLFAAISTTFGTGDGTATFNLPDFRGNVPAGYKSGDTNFGTLGAAVGEATHVLTVGEMPSHNHNPLTTPYGQVGSDYTGSGSLPHVNRDTGSTSNFVSSSNTGGGGAHNNIQPSLTINFIIKT